MALNKIFGDLSIHNLSLTNGLYAAGSISDAKIAAATLTLSKASNSFITDLLDTQLRAIYPMLGTVALEVDPVMDVSALMPAAVSTQAPAYDGVTRTWSDLGAVVYAPENLVTFRTAGGDPVRDNDGREIFGRLTKAGEVSTINAFVIDGLGAEVAPASDPVVQAYVYIKQWVAGSSALLRDTGRVVVTAPGAVDINEKNDIDSLMKAIGLANLPGDGSSPVASLNEGLSLNAWTIAHAGGTSDRHTSGMIDNVVGVDIENLGVGLTLTDSLNQLNDNAILLRTRLQDNSGVSGAAQGIVYTSHNYLTDLTFPAGVSTGHTLKGAIEALDVALSGLASATGDASGYVAFNAGVSMVANGIVYSSNNYLTNLAADGSGHDLVEAAGRLDAALKTEEQARILADSNLSARVDRALQAADVQLVAITDARAALALTVEQTMDGEIVLNEVVKIDANGLSGRISAIEDKAFRVSRILAAVGGETSLAIPVGAPAFTVGAEMVDVFIDGVKAYPGAQYSEAVGGESITFDALRADQTVELKYFA